MKKSPFHLPVTIAGVALALGFASGLPLAATAQPRILFVGNSYTQGVGDSSDRSFSVGGVPAIFDRLAQAGGQVNPTTLMRAVGGTDYQFHAGDPTLRSVLALQHPLAPLPWDYVILQNYSTEPTHLALGDGHSIADHYTYGSELYRRTLSNSPAAHVILYETWSRPQANPIISGVSTPSTFASTAQFQTELRTNYQGLANSLNASYPANPPVIVAPVGDAWQNAGGLLAASDPGFVDLFESDNHHGNDNGYYLAAAVFYSTIYGVSPHGLSSHPLVSGLNLNLTVSPTFLEDTAWATVIATVPEPSSLALVVLAGIGLGIGRRRW